MAESLCELNGLLLSLDDQSIQSSLKEEDWSDHQQNTLIGRAIITIFPVDENIKWLRPETYFKDPTIISIWCGQFEICPSTDKLHAHIYIEFYNAKRLRFNSLVNYFKDQLNVQPNIKVPKRSSTNQRRCAVNYVMKPEGIANGTNPFIWELNSVTVEYNPLIKKRKSKAETIQSTIEYIESRPKHWTWDQIVHESKDSKQMLATCSWGSKYHAGRHAEAKRRTIKETIIFYGAGGTGKTSLAQQHDTRPDENKHDRYYKRNADDGKFWGGGRTAYRGQRIIHLEEFCGQETAANFKEICDIGKEGPSVNIKNSGTDLNHEITLITSNHHPAAWYKNLCHNDHKQWVPICRRFTKVFFFPEKRPDGSLNIPDEQTPAFYEDQTQQFKDFSYSYTDALDHAETYWPLPEETSFGNVKRQKLDDSFSRYCQTGNY